MPEAPCFLIVLIFGGFSTIVVFFATKYNRDLALAQRAGTIAAMIDEGTLTHLSGDISDLPNPVYQDLKKHFMLVRSVNTDLRFVYIFGQHENGDVFFYLDSEAPSSPDYSAPGDLYPEATPAMRTALFENKFSVEQPQTDRWGKWATGYAPIIDSQTHKTIAAVGIDIDARWYYAYILAEAAVPAFLTLVALLITYGGEKLRLKEEEIKRLRAHSDRF